MQWGENACKNETAVLCREIGGDENVAPAHEGLIGF